MANIEALWEGGPQFIQSEHFKLGTDSVLLADFVNTASRKRGIDLGCGSGILPLLLMQRSSSRVADTAPTSVQRRDVSSVTSQYFSV